MTDVTANEYLWGQPALLARLHAAVMAHRKRRDTGCWDCTYAVGEKGKTDYAVIKRRCADGKDRRFYAHHVVMMKKMKDRGAADMWDTVAMQVSHECHNTLCVNPDHLELIPAAANRAKNIHCVGHVTCTTCGVTMRACKHATLCLTVVESICSECLEL